MMQPILIYHFTHVHNLRRIIELGLQSDAICRENMLTDVEVGSASIRKRRLDLAVREVGPGGCVGDYVPWYFGPRSPMMYALSKNRYEYQEGFDEVVYLVSRVASIVAAGGRWIASDRNAALALAAFIDDEDALHDHISWDVIKAQYWNDFTDGADLRSAEFLVHRTVPWTAIDSVTVKTTDTRAKVEALIEHADHRPPVTVRPAWYF